MSDSRLMEIPFGILSGQMESLSLRLAQRLMRQPSGEDRARARLHLLDWLACSMAGSVEAGTVEARRLAALEGRGVCRVIRGGDHGPQAAALANGPAGAILEMDDVDKRGLLHPGPVVIPAVLSAADHVGCDDGNTVLDAIVRGYEAMVRIGRSVGPHHASRFHVTATCGGFGAAVGAGSILGLDTTRMAWAMGNAGQQAFGLWQVRHEPVFTKALHNGRAAANGVASALLAKDGYAGPLNIFEGPHGFFHGLCPDGVAQDVLPADDSWAIHDVSFKPHAACRHAHAGIDAVLALRDQAGGRELVSLGIGTYGDAIVFCDRPTPHSVADAKFSLQHAGAVAWRYGDADLSRFTPDTIADAGIATLRQKFSLSQDAGCEGRYPARFGASAKAVLADGTILEIEVPDALGDPEKPLATPALIAKARALFAWGGLDEAQIGQLLTVAMSLGEGASVGDVWAALPRDEMGVG